MKLTIDNIIQKVFTGTNNLSSYMDILQSDYQPSANEPKEILNLLSNSAKIRDHFNKTMLQENFLTGYTALLLEMILDHQASIQTVNDKIKNISDPNEMDDETVNRVLKQYAFDKYYLMSDDAKRRLIFDIANLYKNKGTIPAVKRILRYVLFLDIEVFEYWLERDRGTDNLNFRGYAPVESDIANTVGIIRKPFSDTIDAHWKLSAENILNLDNDLSMRGLPSLSPYFSLVIDVDMNSLFLGIAFLNAELYRFRDMFYDDYDSYLTYRTWQVNTYGDYVTVIEALLAANYLYWYKYNDDSGSLTDENVVHYNGNSEDNNTYISQYRDLFDVDLNKEGLAREQLSRDRGHDGIIIAGAENERVLIEVERDKSQELNSLLADLEHYAYCAGNGRIFISGGRRKSTGEISNKIFQYDPITDQITEFPNDMPVGLWRHNIVYNESTTRLIIFNGLKDDTAYINTDIFLYTIKETQVAGESFERWFTGGIWLQHLNSNPYAVIDAKAALDVSGSMIYYGPGYIPNEEVYEAIIAGNPWQGAAWETDIEMRINTLGLYTSRVVGIKVFTFEVELLSEQPPEFPSDYEFGRTRYTMFYQHPYLIFAGGQRGTEIIDRVESFDVTNRSWTDLTDLPLGLSDAPVFDIYRYHEDSALEDNFLLIGGWYDSGDTSDLREAIQSEYEVSGEIGFRNFEIYQSIDDLYGTVYLPSQNKYKFDYGDMTFNLEHYVPSKYNQYPINDAAQFYIQDFDKVYLYNTTVYDELTGKYIATNRKYELYYTVESPGEVDHFTPTTYQYGNNPTIIKSDGTFLYTLDRVGTIQQFNIDTGTEITSKNLFGTIKYTTNIATTIETFNSTLFVGYDNGSVNIYDSTPTGGENTLLEANYALTPDEKINKIIALSENEFYCWFGEGITGGIVSVTISPFSFNITRPDRVITDGRTIIDFVVNDEYMYILYDNGIIDRHALDGTLDNIGLFGNTTLNRLYTTLCLSDTHLYMGTTDYKVYAYLLSDGSDYTNGLVGNETKISKSPIDKLVVHDNNLYVMPKRAVLIKIELDDGMMIRQGVFGVYGLPKLTSIDIDSSYVYLGSNTGFLRKYGIDNGYSYSTMGVFDLSTVKESGRDQLDRFTKYKLSGMFYKTDFDILPDVDENLALLQIINPKFADYIVPLFDLPDEQFNIAFFEILSVLDDYCYSKNIRSGFRALFIANDDSIIPKIIDEFKPVHSRYSGVSLLYTVKDRIQNSLRIDDNISLIPKLYGEDKLPLDDALDMEWNLYTYENFTYIKYFDQPFNRHPDDTNPDDKMIMISSTGYDEAFPHQLKFDEWNIKDSAEIYLTDDVKYVNDVILQYRTPAEYQLLLDAILPLTVELLVNYDAPTGLIPRGTAIDLTNDAPYMMTDLIDIKAEPNLGYMWSQWSGDIGWIYWGDVEDEEVQLALYPPQDITLTAEFLVDPTQYFRLNTDITEDWHGSTIGDGDYNVETEVSLEVSLNPGYRLVDWTGNTDLISTGTVNDELISIIMEASEESKLPSPTAPWLLIANTEVDPAQTFNLTINSIGHGSAVDNTNTGPYTVEEIISLTATPDLGYMLDTWSSDATPITGTDIGLFDDDTSNNTTYKMTAEDTNIEATFIVDPSQTWEVNVSGASYLLWERGNPLDITSWANKPNYPVESVVLLSANANPGYKFSTWTGDVGFLADNIANPTITSMPTQNVNLVAEYIIDTTQNFLLEIGTVPGDEDKGVVLASDSYNVETNVELNAVADNGYIFNTWVEKNPGDSDYIDDLGLLNANVTMPGKTIGFNADFIVDVTQFFDLTLTSTGNGTFVDNTGTGSYNVETLVNVLATPDTGYKVSYQGDTQYLANLVDNDNTVTMPNSNISIEAQFIVDPSQTFNLTIEPGVNGSGIDVTGTNPYNVEDIVSIDVTPDLGYKFTEWIGDIAYINDPNTAATNVTMPALDISITPTFEVDPSQYFNLTLSDDGNGTAIDEIDSGPYVVTSIVDILATPNYGYVFDQWTGDISTVDDIYNPDTTVTINGNISLSAQFLLDTRKTLRVFIPNTTAGEFSLVTTGHNITNVYYTEVKIEPGETVTLSANALDVYTNYGWVVDPYAVQWIDQNTQRSFSDVYTNFAVDYNADHVFTMPNEDTTISLIFESMPVEFITVDFEIVEETDLNTDLQGADFYIAGTMKNRYDIDPSTNPIPGIGTSLTCSYYQPLQVFALTSAGSGYRIDRFIVEPANGESALILDGSATVGVVEFVTSIVIPEVSNITVKAVCVPDTNTITLSDDGNGTANIVSQPRDVLYEGDVVSIEAIPTPGYGFVNWTGDTQYITDPNSAATNITMPEDGGVNLTANFVELQLTLAYDGNGQTSGTAPASVYPVSVSNPTTVAGYGDLDHTTYTIYAWNTEPDGTGEMYYPGDPITLTEDTTLYIWWTDPLELTLFNANSAIIPLFGDVDVLIDWGDGSPIEHFTTDEPSHSYPSPPAATYDISITGHANRFGVGNGPFGTFTYRLSTTLQSLNSFGKLGLTSLSGAFRGQTNDVYHPNTADFIPDTVTDLSGMFRDAQYCAYPKTNWNVSNVTNMDDMFNRYNVFGGDNNTSLGVGAAWDVSNVTSMYAMFMSNATFNENISGWDVSNVTDMTNLFFSCPVFNQDLSGWNVSNVTSYNNYDYNTPAWQEVNKPNFPV